MSYCIRFALLKLLITNVLAAASAPATPPVDLRGALHDLDGVRVMVLEGSPHEAGFAHGYLLAEEIVTLFDEYVLSKQVTSNPRVYQHMLLPATLQRFEWSDDAEEELAGIIAGINARLSPEQRQVPKLGRALEVDDLKVVNTIADWKGRGCSTFSVWGERTASGATLTGRNLDYPSTPSMRDAQLIVVRRNAAPQRSWVSVTWPGLIGLYTTMNDAGVSMLMHDVELGEPEPAPFTPRSLVIREIIEQATPERFIQQAQAVLSERRVMCGNNFHLSAPRRGSEPTAVVFEYDSRLKPTHVTTRLEDTALVGETLYCTNHYRDRDEPERCNRFETLQQKLAPSAIKTIDVAGAFDLLREVQVRSTLHSIVALPAERVMHVRLFGSTQRDAIIDLKHWLPTQPKATKTAAKPVHAKPTP